MTRIRYCDRCKKIDKKVIASLRVYIIEKSPFNSGNVFDLCRKCFDSFLNWKKI